MNKLSPEVKKYLLLLDSFIAVIRGRMLPELLPLGILRVVATVLCSPEKKETPGTILEVGRRGGWHRFIVMGAGREKINTKRMAAISFLYPLGTPLEVKWFKFRVFWGVYSSSGAKLTSIFFNRNVEKI